MQLTNSKLIDRGTKMVMERTGITDYERAKELLLQFGALKSRRPPIAGRHPFIEFNSRSVFFLLLRKTNSVNL
jgi:hypothetical protein